MPKFLPEWLSAGRNKTLIGQYVKRSAIFTIVSLEHGGAQRQLIEIAKHFNHIGWSLTVCSLLPKLQLLPELTEAGVTVRVFDISSTKKAISNGFRFFSLVRRSKPDVILGFAYHANLFVKIAGSLAGCEKIITSFRSVEFGGSLRDWLERITFRFAHKTVVNSFASLAALERRRVVPRGKAVVIRNVLAFSPHECGSAAGAPRPGKDKSLKFHWLAVGRLDPAKDYGTLLLASDILRRRNHAFQLRIAGEGPCRVQLERSIRELDLGSCVSLLGHIHDIRRQFHWCDAVVMSSTREGLPNALIEAMFFGKPVVATSVGGVPDLVNPGITGALAPPANPRALAQAMGDMMLAGDKMVQMGAAGREFVLREFNAARIMNQWEHLFAKE
jgi:glycosyltransferase involved in cell wall biosynthesis